MARTYPAEDTPDVEEEVNEEDDDDFNPENAPADESASSSSEDDDAPAPAQPLKGRRKRKALAEDELDSGDEITIQAARKRKAKKRKGDPEDDDDLLLLSDDEGGEGGLVKTRAQRRDELKERRPLARTEGATIDVDAMWEQMLAAPLKPLFYAQTQQQSYSGVPGEVQGTAAAANIVEEEEQVKITKVYTFAGQNTTEEKEIPRSHLEKYLSDGWKQADVVPIKQVEEADEAKDDSPKIRRPLRRPSRYDPNPTGFVRALPPENQLTWPRKPTAIAAASQENLAAPEAAKPVRPEKAQKLNVVDKSRLDWTGFVDKEGIAEELDTHGKTKEAYLGRMNFLAGVEAKQEEERKRMKTTAAPT